MKETAPRLSTRASQTMTNADMIVWDDCAGIVAALPQLPQLLQDWADEVRECLPPHDQSREIRRVQR